MERIVVETVTMTYEQLVELQELIDNAYNDGFKKGCEMGYEDGKNDVINHGVSK